MHVTCGRFLLHVTTLGAVLNDREEVVSVHSRREARQHRYVQSLSDRVHRTRLHERNLAMKKLIALLTLLALVSSVAVSAATAQTRKDQNIVQTAVAAGQFNTLAKLLTRAGLVDALQQPGPFTVFAPTDAAFKKMPKRTLNALLRNKAKLKAVLLYHVVSGKVTAANVVKLASAKTLSGKPVRIRVAGSNVLVNSSKVTAADVMASNGVIHVINRVLIPPVR
jgi:uncharacterized surface protein with fasciclin (FAS1) repeats